MMGRKPSKGVDKKENKGYNESITDKERTFVIHEINKWYHKRYMNEPIFFHYSAEYDAEYTVLNKGYNNYDFLHKNKIITRKR